MNIITKSGLSGSAAREMVSQAFASKLIKMEEIREGFFDSDYKFYLDSGGTVILKLVPKYPDYSTEYDADALETEIAALNKISEFKYLPVPHILFYDNTHKIIDGDYLFINSLPGESFSNVKSELKASEISELFTQAGIYAHKINSITADFFGSLSKKENQFGRWSEAFFSMVDSILCDAEASNIDIPVDHDRIRKTISDEKVLFDEVKRPSLIHRNLWTGNILIDRKNTEISGIVNFEHSLYADPLMEPVFGIFDGNRNFMCSYNSGKQFEKKQKARMSLYKTYFGLWGITQCARHRYPDDSVGIFYRKKLEDGLNEYRLYTGHDF